MSSEVEETKIINELESQTDLSNNSSESKLKSGKSWIQTRPHSSNAIDALLEESRLLLNQSHEITEPFQNSINLETSKEQMVIYLQTKIDKVTQRIRLVEHKYGEYKKLSDAMNIGIILLSTALTLLESIKTEIGMSEMTAFVQFISYRHQYYHYMCRSYTQI